MTQHLTNETLQDYIHSDLSPQEDAQVYTHLEQCADCRAEYDAENTIGESLRAYAAETERELPATLKAAIWSEIRSARPSFWSRFTASFRPAMALPVAAVIAAGVYFGVTNMGSPASPSIEAAYYLQDHAAMNDTTPFSDRGGAPANLESASVSATDQQSVAIEATTYTADASNR
ncbi:MAG TPA: anti-sigma factor [Candidatus Baltobacteraceae bacterium]|nr:anti-sigma factor [Candidatus Baltobacteraceae bacterium]